MDYGIFLTPVGSIGGRCFTKISSTEYLPDEILLEVSSREFEYIKNNLVDGRLLFERITDSIMSKIVINLIYYNKFNGKNALAEKIMDDYIKFIKN